MDSIGTQAPARGGIGLLLAVGGPLLFGLLAQHLGTSVAWIAACVTMVAATVTLLVVRAVPATRSPSSTSRLDA